MFKRISNNKGFTLLEIIVSLAILGIVIMPIMSTIITGYKINKIGEIEYNASMLAQKYMETVKSWKVLNPTNIRAYTGDIEGFTTNLSLEKIDAYENRQPEKLTTTYDMTIERSGGLISFKNMDIVLRQISDTDEFDISFNNSDLIINGETVAFSFINSSPKIGISIDKDVKINARNNTDIIISADIIKSQTSSYVCDINVLNGEITKRINIIDNSFVKSADGILYKVIIKVTYEGKEILELIGYKVFN